MPAIKAQVGVFRMPEDYAKRTEKEMKEEYSE